MESVDKSGHSNRSRRRTAGGDGELGSGSNGSNEPAAGTNWYCTLLAISRAGKGQLVNIVQAPGDAGAYS